MRNLIFVLTLFLIATACLPQRSYQEDAIRYFKLNGTENQYSGAVDQMFELLKNQYSAQGVPESIWVELQKEKPQALENIKSMLVSVYQSNFTQKDIQELILFYESETGKQMVQNVSALTEKQKEEFNNFLASEVGKKVQNQSESLKTMVGEVSESWSSTLYQDMIEKLEAQGFKLSK